MPRLGTAQLSHQISDVTSRRGAHQRRIHEVLVSRMTELLDLHRYATYPRTRREIHRESHARAWRSHKQDMRACRYSPAHAYIVLSTNKLHLCTGTIAWRSDPRVEQDLLLPNECFGALYTLQAGGNACQVMPDRCTAIILSAICCLSANSMAWRTGNPRATSSHHIVTIDHLSFPRAGATCRTRSLPIATAIKR